MEKLRFRKPQVAVFTVSGGTTHNVDFGQQVGFVQATNFTNHSLTVLINGDSSARFTLSANTSQTFDVGDLYLVSLLFDNTPSGASDIQIEVIYGI